MTGSDTCEPGNSPDTTASAAEQDAVTIHLPADASGAALAATVHQLRAALLHHDVIIDTRRVNGFSPGLLIALSRFSRCAQQAGSRWRILGAAPRHPSVLPR